MLYCSQSFFNYLCLALLSRLVLSVEEKLCSRIMFPSHRCLKACHFHYQCFSLRKKCVCDGECGKSCINPSNRCKYLNGSKLQNGKFRLIPYNKFGAKAVYRCDIGYILHGDKARTCRGDGTWSGNMPICIHRDSIGLERCSLPPTVILADYRISHHVQKWFDIGEVLTYRCRYGYKTEPGDITKAYCSYGGSWIGPNMTCTLAGCERPTVISNAKMTVSNSPQFYGSTVTYKCASGYYSRTNLTRICLENEHWSGTLPYCEPVRCGAVPVIPDAVPVYNTTLEYTAGSVVTYRCHNGYSLVGKSFITCSVTGEWQESSFACQIKVCKDPGVLRNGLTTGSNFTYSQIIYHTCNNGYILNGSSNQTCNSLGYWSGTRPYCDPVRCTRLAVPQHSSVIQNTGFSFKSTMSFKCDRGYRNIGSHHRTCLSNGSWSGKAAKCVVITCGPVPVIYNGYTDGHSYIYGSTHFYRCHFYTTYEGGAMSTTCQENGKWSHNAPICMGQCQIPIIFNGTILRYLSEEWVNHNTTVNNQCHPGFEPVESSLSTCINGSWTVTPACVPESCSGPPPNIDNGMRIFFQDNHGDIVRYECTVGHQLIGSPYLHCQFGEWLGKLPQCKEAFCPNPGKLNNGFVYKRGSRRRFLFMPYIYSIHHGYRVEYECEKNYRLEGPSGSVCVDREWNPSHKPQCVRSSHMPYKHLWHIRRFYV